MEGILRLQLLQSRASRDSLQYGKRIQGPEGSGILQFRKISRAVDYPQLHVLGRLKLCFLRSKYLHSAQRREVASLKMLFSVTEIYYARRLPAVYVFG